MSVAGRILSIAVPLGAIAAIWLAAPLPTSVRAGLTAGVVAVACVPLVRRRVRRKLAGRTTQIVPRRANTDDAVLASLGIDVGDGELKAACSRVARRLHNERIRVVGFVPAEDTVAVPPVLIQLGMALTELTGATIAVVDANVRYPGLGALNRGQETDSEDSVFSTRWLYGSLALLSAPHVESAGQVVPQLARVLIDGADLFAHVLVDLTGFELLGEHASAAACMDAVALVGRTHHTREKELLELARLMPQGRFLGVLLVG
ncbi:MAG: hypothetical protein E6J90_14930 [Deltaproteobacteria bacterium]|nr:MAG: hypothetical protein E6J91_07135 [Deltaproteobacteria bacterium]TMQ21061.1 MAG: hypothetical protein E6J90_14930 [Deltaproteobacteria bacterium]